MMKTIEMKRVAATLFAGAMVIATPAQAASLLKGEHMIAGCLEHAASEKYPPMSIGVIDASGALVAFKRQDGASPATAEAALLKARTSARVHAPTAALASVAAGDATYRDAFIVLQFTTLTGGIPIADPDGRVIGAIGVSGGLAEQDARCAEKALEAGQIKK